VCLKALKARYQLIKQARNRAEEPYICPSFECIRKPGKIKEE
jgi:hypothetical protein